MRKFVKFIAGPVGGEAKGDCHSRGAGRGAAALVKANLDGECFAFVQRRSGWSGACVFGRASAGKLERNEDSAARGCARRWNLARLRRSDRGGNGAAVRDGASVVGLGVDAP